MFNPEVPPDLLVELLPVVMWLENAVGYSTNRCSVACATLQHTYAALGITARPLAVDLVVHNERTGERNLYGSPEPYWDGNDFHGHCVLSLPASGRFIDPTVEQYPEVRRHRLGPICGRTVAGTAARPDQLAALERGTITPGSQIAVRRKNLLLVYTAADEEFHDVITTGASVVQHRAELERSGRIVAAQTLLLLTHPDVIDRARRSPHQRVRALLDQMDGAELVESEQDSNEPLIRLRDETAPRTLTELLHLPNTRSRPATPPRAPRSQSATRPAEIPGPRVPAPTDPVPEDPSTAPRRRGPLRRLLDSLRDDNHPHRPPGMTPSR